jgi:competence protein ComFC
MHPIRRLIAELLAVTFPARCGACDRVIAPEDDGVCPGCSAETLGLIDQGYCNKCGQDAGPFALKPAGQGGVLVCGLCDQSLYRYDSLVRVGAYVDPLGGMIRKFKYADRQHMAGVLGQWQAARLAAQPWFETLDALVPVPMHWRRRLGRGFNQSDLLAERVGGRLARPVLRALSRPVSRPPQASLPRSKRFENVRGVFSVVARSGAIRGRRLCLIDDVCTTGATLSEAARTLLGAGAEAVYAAVVAVAQPPPAYSAMMNDPA